ncbi:MAG: hypothetical protein GXP05_00055, partial [Alphaproteobacteria bacterium]|nr:hypothetical protein [Alphaproteobacteria bacterium]
MAKFTITASGSVALGDGDTLKIDIPTGGNVVVTADPFGNVGEIKIDFQNFDTISNQATVDLGTFSQNGLQIDIKNYDPTDQVSLKGASITRLVPGSTDELAFSYVGADGATYTGVAHIKDDGQQNFNATQKPLTICFTTGARIRGVNGDIPVEDLVIGDLVQTLHHGAQTLRWIGVKRLSNV